MQVLKKYLNELTYQMIACSIEVHKVLGTGLRESICEKCFCGERTQSGIRHRSQVKVALHDKGLELETEVRCDVLVEDCLVIELKAIEWFRPIHEVVLLTYLVMLEKPKGVLITFHCTNIFKEEQRSMVNDSFRNLPDEKSFSTCA